MPRYSPAYPILGLILLVGTGMKKGGLPSGIPEVPAATVRSFQKDLNESRWDQVLQKCSPRFKEAASRAHDLGAFINTTIPIKEISGLDTFPYCSVHWSQLGALDKLDLATSFTCLTNVAIEGTTETYVWTWDVYKAGSDWKIDIAPVPYRDVIAAEKKRLDKQSQDRIACLAELKPKLQSVRTVLTPLSDGRVELGKEIKFRLELINDGPHDFHYEDQQVGVNNPMIIRDAKGTAARNIGPPTQTDGNSKHLPARSKVSLLDSFDITTQYAITSPGRYTVQHSGSGLSVWVDSCSNDTPIPSNIVVIDVTN